MNWEEHKMEWNELEEELKELEPKEVKGESIEKQVNKRIQKIVVQTVGMIAILGVVIFGMISPSVALLYPNPTKLDTVVYEDLDTTMVSLALQQLLDLVSPYQRISMKPEVKNKGFGNYEIEVGVHSTVGDILPQQGKISINRGEFELRNLTLYYGVPFTSIIDDFSIDHNKTVLEELPDNTKMTLSISLEEGLHVEQLLALGFYSNSNIVWAGSTFGQSTGNIYGFDPGMGHYPKSELDEKYPNLFAPRLLTQEGLDQYFTSKLQFIIDTRKDLGLFEEVLPTSTLQKMMLFIEEEGVTLNQLMIDCSKEEALTWIEKLEGINGLQVSNVRYNFINY